MSDELWSLEWSHRYNCLHAHPLRHTLDRVREQFARNIAAPNDYQILYVGTAAEVDSMARIVRPFIVRRQPVVARKVVHRYFDPHGIATLDADFAPQPDIALDPLAGTRKGDIYRGN